MANAIRNKNIPTSSRRRPMELSYWLRHAFSENPDRPVDDIHLDELVGPWQRGVGDGLEWVRYSCGVLQSVAQVVHSKPELNVVRAALIALPLESSEALRLWEPALWRYAGMDYEPPSLYLMKDDLFQRFRNDEEYFRRLQCPISDCPGVYAEYRSSRNLDGEHLSDDFTNVIELVVRMRDHAK